MMSALQFLFFFVVNLKCTFADIIECKDINQCKNQNITCNENEDCTILCSGESSCYGAIINCPLDGTCIIQCNGQNACRQSKVYAKHSKGNFSILCQSKYEEHATTPGYWWNDMCRDITIYGSLLNHNIGSIFNVICGASYRSCLNSEIHCAKDMNCEISCNHTESCQEARFYGPQKPHSFIVNCNYDQSCRETEIYSLNATSLTINGCIVYESCDGLTYQCPRNGTCYRESAEPTPTPTSIPSKIPTETPSKYPTTQSLNPSETPTKQPTSYPTTYLPTTIPSLSPTAVSTDKEDDDDIVFLFIGIGSGIGVFLFLVCLLLILYWILRRSYKKTKKKKKSESFKLIETKSASTSPPSIQMEQIGHQSVTISGDNLNGNEDVDSNNEDGVSSTKFIDGSTMTGLSEMNSNENEELSVDVKNKQVALNQIVRWIRSLKPKKYEPAPELLDDDSC